MESGGTLLWQCAVPCQSGYRQRSAFSAIGSAGTVQLTSIEEGGGGTISVVGGTLTDDGVFAIGASGNGALVTIGSLGVVAEVGYTGIQIGAASGSSGTIAVGAGGTLYTNGGLNVGSASGSTGTLAVSGGTVIDTSASFFVGNTNASGTLLVEGGGTLITAGGGMSFADINGTGTGGRRRRSAAAPGSRTAR